MTPATAILPRITRINADQLIEWIIERRFAGPVPAWDQVGAEFVDDVTPFEAMKLRLLNASHSTLAWLGLLAGFESVAEAMAEPRIAAVVQALMEREASPTLNLPANYPLAEYRDRVFERFSNRALRHRNLQIASDSSQKIPQRLLPILRWNLEHGGPIDCTTLAIATWLRCLAGVDGHSKGIVIEDPMAGTCAELFRLESTETAIDKILRLKPIFGDLFDRHPTAARCVRTWFARLQQEGADILGAFNPPTLNQEDRRQ